MRVDGLTGIESQHPSTGDIYFEYLLDRGMLQIGTDYLDQGIKILQSDKAEHKQMRKYGHYWSRKTVVSKAIWSRIVRDINSLMAQFGKQWELGDVSCSDSLIYISAKDESLSPFVMSRVLRIPDRQNVIFVPTSRTPFGNAVKAVLVILKHYLKGDIIISSDYFTYEWQEEIDLVSNVCVLLTPFKLDHEPQKVEV